MSTSPLEKMPPSRRRGEEAALLLIRRLREERTSPTVLYYLRLPEKVLRPTEMGSLLLSLCEELKIPLHFEESFFHAVEKAVSPLSPVPGSFFRVAKTKSGAVDAFRKELHKRRASHPERKYLYMGATMPSCFQTLRGKAPDVDEHTGSLFFVFSDPENMLHHALDMLHLGHYTFNNALIPVCQIYEMRLNESFLHGFYSENRLAYIILDWELKESEVRGRLTGEQIHQLGEMFPQWFYRRMYDEGHVGKNDKIMAVVKQKTRALRGGDVKHSFHVTFNVCGVPGVHLQHVIRGCLGKSEKTLGLFKSKAEGASASAFVDPETGEDCIFDHPEIGFDFSGVTGNTGVAMFGSRKSDKDPYCALTSLYIFSQGGVHVFPRESGIVNPSEFDPLPSRGSFDYPEHDITKLTRKQALDLMYQSSCSVPRDLMVLPQSADESRKGDRKDEQNRTAFRATTPSSGGGAPPAHGGPGAAGQSTGKVVPLLPAWFRDILGKSGLGSDEPDWANNYKTHVKNMELPGTDPEGWSVTRYGSAKGNPKSGCPCPHHFSFADNPCLHYHSNNGIILAVNSALPGIVFARCTNCRGCHVTNDYVQRVRSREGIPTYWVSLSEDGFKDLMQKLEDRVMAKQHAEKIVRGASKIVEKRNEFMETARSYKRPKL